LPFGEAFPPTRNSLDSYYAFVAQVSFGCCRAALEWLASDMASPEAIRDVESLALSVYKKCKFCRVLLE
jgi:hypothetical protein